MCSARLCPCSMPSHGDSRSRRSCSAAGSSSPVPQQCRLDSYSNCDFSLVPGSQMSGEATARCCLEWNVTYGAAVPTIWQGVRQALGEGSSSGFCVEKILCGGSVPPAEMMGWYQNKFGTAFLQGFGMTETNPNVTIGKMRQKWKHRAWSKEDQFQNCAKPGLLVPMLEWKIVDPEDFDKELAQDGVAAGELLLRGPTITGSYYKNPSADNKFHKGWLCTGDVCSIDSEGYMVIRDRSKDLIKSGGEWISSVDLEAHIVGLPDVAMCAVVAQEHPKWDERPVAVVVPASQQVGVNVGQLMAFCAKKFAKYELPDDVLTWPELPLTSTGKLDKKSIRQKLKDSGYRLPSLRNSKL
eukprot:TRINITY_DN11660_c0_g2_i6.p2 TRINITY_DN11660_c0_g2~~TRINITY_DN11660_c0_g2_i6.p2  ORF type:complete len:354 (+),score=73.20 TRINITY_DN11660_c0_g2_i6:922-1983(+)